MCIRCSVGNGIVPLFNPMSSYNFQMVTHVDKQRRKHELLELSNNTIIQPKVPQKDFKNTPNFVTSFFKMSLKWATMRFFAGNNGGLICLTPDLNVMITSDLLG